MRSFDAPALLGDRLAIPAIVAPMFLVSGPDLVVECCKAGLLGTFPVLNQRSSEGYGEWLDEIEGRLAGETWGCALRCQSHRSQKQSQARG